MYISTIGENLIELNETDSTNSYASRLLYDGLPVEGTVIMARYQTIGRGQRGSAWESEPGKNLLVSYILYPSFILPARFFVLNQAISLGVYDCIRAFTSKQVAIKWPNDILVEDKKIAGLLLENAIRENRFVSCIAGIGINLNQQKFNQHNPPATSIINLESASVAPESVLEQLNKSIDKWYMLLKAGSFKKIQTEYQKVLYRKNIVSKFERGKIRFDGTIKGVNEMGQLIIADANDHELLFNYKEVRYIF